MLQTATASKLKLIRDMDASQIEAHAHNMRIGKIPYDLMVDVEMDKQYKQLTGKNYIDSPSPAADKEMRAYLKSLK